MKKYSTFVTLVLFLVGLLFFSACGVTETGNPQMKLPDALDAPAEGGDAAATGSGGDSGPSTETYENTTFGLLMTYPSDWTLTAPAAEDPNFEREVLFFNDSRLTTIAQFFFSNLDLEAGSLLAYLESLYPSRTFVPFSSLTLVGYLFDDPSQGANGGDLREYFFADNGVLIRGEAVVFADGEEDLKIVLQGISFTAN